MGLKIKIDQERIATTCRKWKVKELAIFGSALRDDFRPDSDVDVMVVFDDAAEWSLFDVVAMIEDLKQVFGREVDLVEKDAIRNPFRRHHIVNHHQVVYAA